jgi:hypothetical protein
MYSDTLTPVAAPPFNTPDATAAASAPTASAVARVTRTPELVAAVLAHLEQPHARLGHRHAWPESVFVAAPRAPRRNVAPLGRARLVCRLWAAEGLRVQWRSVKAAQLARVVGAPDARRRVAELVELLGADHTHFGGLAGTCFPRLRELRALTHPFESAASVDALYDLLGRCGSDGGCGGGGGGGAGGGGRDGGASGGHGPSGGAVSAAARARSTLQSVKVRVARPEWAFPVTATLLSHLARHPRLRYLQICGMFTGAVLAQVSAGAESGCHEASAPQHSTIVERLFRQLHELDIAIASDAVNMLMSLLARHASKSFTHLSLCVELAGPRDALVPHFTAFPELQQNLRSLNLFFDSDTNPRLSAGDFDCLRSLTQLTELSLAEGDKHPVEASPDLTREKLIELLASLGVRLRALKLFVAASWLSSYASLELFGRLCPLLTRLRVCGNYSLDALDSVNAAEARAEPGDASGGADAEKSQCTSRPVFPHLEFLRIKGFVHSDVVDCLLQLDDARAWFNSETAT